MHELPDWSRLCFQSRSYLHALEDSALQHKAQEQCMCSAQQSKCKLQTYAGKQPQLTGSMGHSWQGRGGQLDVPQLAPDVPQADWTFSRQYGQYRWICRPWTPNMAQAWPKPCCAINREPCPYGCCIFGCLPGNRLSTTSCTEWPSTLPGTFLAQRASSSTLFCSPKCCNF